MQELERRWEWKGGGGSIKQAGPSGAPALDADPRGMHALAKGEAMEAARKREHEMRSEVRRDRMEVSQNRV